MALAFGLVALAVVVIGVVAAILFAGKQADSDASPRSHPDDFVAPVSSGGFAFRQTDESKEEFQARIARENASPGRK